MSFPNIESARVWAFERVLASEASADMPFPEVLAAADELAEWVRAGSEPGLRPEHLALLQRLDALDRTLKSLGRRSRDHVALSTAILKGLLNMSTKTDALAREIAELRESAEAVAAKLAANEAAGAAKDAQIAELATQMQGLTAQLAEAQGDAELVGTLTAELDGIQQGLAALAAPAPEPTPEPEPVEETAPVEDETDPVEDTVPVTEEGSSEPVTETAPVEEQAPAPVEGEVVAEQPATDPAAPQQ